MVFLKVLLFNICIVTSFSTFVESMKTCHHRTECDGFCQVGTQLCQWDHCACGKCTHQVTEAEQSIPFLKASAITKTKQPGHKILLNQELYLQRGLNMLPIIFALSMTVYTTQGASYSDLLLNDLSQLYQLQQPESGGRYGYYDDELVGRSMPDDWSLNMDDPNLFSRASIRDPELIQQLPSLWGYQSMSGGTGGGKENPKQVKTDKVLPAYCNPPNPCPVGYTADDNCVEKFENSLDNNRRLLKQQDCPCDAEHMFSCPAENDQEIKQTGNYPEWMQQNSNSDLDSMSLDKREKKGGNHMRYRRDNERIMEILQSKLEKMKNNPYFNGPHREVAAKKGDPLMNKH